MAGPGQGHVGQTQVLAALLAQELLAVARRSRRPRGRRRACGHRRPRGRGRRPAVPRGAGSPPPTGRAGRRSGTRAPCCGGWSGPAPPRRRIPAGGCAPRRWCRARPRRSGCAATRSARSCPSCSSAAAACRSWPTWRRSVSGRSPSWPGRASAAGSPSASVIVSSSEATPRPRSTRAQSCSRRCTASQAQPSSSAAASCAADQPRNGRQRRGVGARTSRPGARAPRAGPASRARARWRTRCRRR